MQDVKAMAQMFARYNSLEKAHFLLWAGQAMDRGGPVRREERMKYLGQTLALPEFVEATWLVHEMSGEMDRAEKERGFGTIPIKASGFEREDNNGEFDVDIEGQVSFVAPALRKAAAAVDERYQAETLKARGSCEELALAYVGGARKYGRESTFAQQDPPLVLGDIMELKGVQIGYVVRVDDVASTITVSLMRNLSYSVEEVDPVRECEECRGTGVYTSQITAEVSPCSQGCRT